VLWKAAAADVPLKTPVSPGVGAAHASTVPSPFVLDDYVRFKDDPAGERFHVRGGKRDMVYIDTNDGLGFVASAGDLEKVFVEQPAAAVKCISFGCPESAVEYDGEDDVPPLCRSCAARNQLKKNKKADETGKAEHTQPPGGVPVTPPAPAAAASALAPLPPPLKRQPSVQECHERGTSARACIPFASMVELPCKPHLESNHVCCLCAGDCVERSQCASRYTMAQGSFADGKVEHIYYCDDCFNGDLESVHFSDRGLFTFDMSARVNDSSPAAAAAPPPPLKRQPLVRRFMKCEECHKRKPDVHEVCGGGWVVCNDCRFSSEED
jgi:hypothetical protein